MNLFHKTDIAAVEADELKWMSEKEVIERRQKLQAEKDAIKKTKSIPTSKLLIAFLFINCSIIEIFTGWAIVRMLNETMNTGILDFTPLNTLIGAIVGEVIGYAVYSLKSAKENSKGGITYDLAMQQRNINVDPEEIHEDGTVG